jgi:hypothetical protein
MKIHISEILAILGVVSEFYAAGIGDGGGSRRVSSETFLEPEEQQEKGSI